MIICNQDEMLFIYHTLSSLVSSSSKLTQCPATLCWSLFPSSSPGAPLLAAEQIWSGKCSGPAQMISARNLITLNRNSSVVISSSGFNIPLFSRGTTQVLRIFDTSSAAKCSESDFARTWSEVMLRPGTATFRYTSLSLAENCQVT